MQSNLLKKNSTYKVEFSWSLLLDFKDLMYYFSYYKVNRPFQIKLFKKLSERMLSLEHFPERFRVYSNDKDGEIRITSVKNYNIYYTINYSENRVKILRVLNCKVNQEIFD